MIRISRGDILRLFRKYKHYKYKFHGKNYPNFLEIDSQISRSLLQITKFMNIRIIKNHSFHLIKMIRRNETF